MKYLWTEDTGAGLHFWKLVNQLFFDDALVVESKESNQGLLDALSDIDMKEDDKYYIAFDYVVDNQDIRNKYRMLKSIADKAEGKIIILDMICFEYLILAFDKLVAWTGTGKTDKIKIREEALSAIEDHRINLSKIDDEKTLQYLAGFKRYSTELGFNHLRGDVFAVAGFEEVLDAVGQEQFAVLDVTGVARMEIPIGIESLGIQFFTNLDLNYRSVLRGSLRFQSAPKKLKEALKYLPLNLF